MNDLFVAFSALFRLRAGPQDLPYSPRLLAGLVAVELMLDLLTAQIMATPETVVSPLRTIVAAALTLLVLYAVLAVGKKTGRFVQTATAWVAVKLLFELVTLPMVSVVGHPPATPEALTLAQGLLTFPMIGALIWWLAAATNVIRHALELRAALAFPIVLGLLFIVPLLASF
jgi:hypothetical protein